MGFTKGMRVRDHLLDSIVEHAKLFAAEHSELKPDEIHEALESAVDRGLLEFDIVRSRRPEIREGESVNDDPLRCSPVEQAADRVLDKLKRSECAD